MKGWKTWTGVVIVAVSAGLRVMGGEYEELANFLMAAGGALGLVGLGYKIEKEVL